MRNNLNKLISIHVISKYYIKITNLIEFLLLFYFEMKYKIFNLCVFLVFRKSKKVIESFFEFDIYFLLKKRRKKNTKGK